MQGEGQKFWKTFANSFEGICGRAGRAATRGGCPGGSLPPDPRVYPGQYEAMGVL